MTHLLTAPWRDPISGRWITPRPIPPAATPAAEPIDIYAEAVRTVRIDSIWEAVKSTAVASTIADQE